ncbi:hypothetical protein CVD28_11110 [Bacillus sp. M6-12]|uniref:glycosyltransferase family 2 protein n=1 Tax=Bacillus sp. M6-12 TaxID=2054166 RepID=UPI000C7632A4|nr:glycosyltransferase [Bacillus sp. M6-12]PLS17541.1 hypothetical protein CVD28_11110 [Bacillus sp. M6-12]
MSIEVTVILPSFNRYPLNQLSLYALENQTFDLSKMEVIFVDDASTDETPSLKNYKAPFAFRYIRNNENYGRSKTRNTGIKEAKGQILIFLDAEVIVGPEFVKNHYQRHLTQEPLVVTGKYVNKLYSYLFPGFDKYQLRDVRKLSKNSDFAKSRIKPAMETETGQPVQLLFKQDILSLPTIKQFSKPKTYEEKIVSAFNDKFRLPWISCTTLNHSVRKSLVDSIGGFDESFIGHGLEDYEYGFRLYQAGARFSYDPNISVYHQEHAKEGNWSKNNIRNLILFQQKHPFIDVYLLSLEKIGVHDYTFMDNIMSDYQTIMHKYPDLYTGFIKALQALLRQIPLLKSDDKPVTNLFTESGIEDNLDWKSRIELEYQSLKHEGFEHVTKLYDLLTGL